MRKGNRAGRRLAGGLTLSLRGDEEHRHRDEDPVRPGALGLARAYVSGHLDVEGDMITALSRLSKAQNSQMGLGDRLRLLQSLGGPKVLFPRVPPPPQEVRIRRRWLGGQRH